MSWNLDVSIERIRKHLESIGEIEIEKLVREADLHALLSETCCREIFGAHVYLDVPNFNALASGVDGDDYRRIVQAVHLYQRELSRIVEHSELLDGVRVHFQGQKLHALFYRPIDDASEIASRAVLLQLVVRDFVQQVFNPAYPTLKNITVAGGADIGTAIGTQDGMKGDRELLFLGTPANYAAKIVRPGLLAMTSAVFALLPDTLQDRCEKRDDGTHVLVPISGDDLQDLAAEFGIDWAPSASKERIEEDKRRFPLKAIECGDADVLIDMDLLGVNNNKRVLATSLFADVDKFTAYIGAADNVQKKKTALRVLHAIRKEMASVVKHDFDGIRVQYQGDRVQGVFHLPKSDSRNIVDKSLATAIGLQSSMEIALKRCLPEAATLGLAIGLDIGITLLSKLGIRAARDRICMGTGVQAAAETQEKCRSTEIGLTPRVFKLLEATIAEQFRFDGDRGIYVAQQLTAEKAERLARAAAYASGPVYVSSPASAVRVTTNKSVNEREILPSRSWAK